MNTRGGGSWVTKSRRVGFEYIWAAAGLQDETQSWYAIRNHERVRGLFELCSSKRQSSLLFPHSRTAQGAPPAMDTFILSEHQNAQPGARAEASPRRLGPSLLCFGPHGPLLLASSCITRDLLGSPPALRFAFSNTFGSDFFSGFPPLPLPLLSQPRMLATRLKDASSNRKST